MADQSARTFKKPRPAATAVRGFLNVAAPLPESGAVAQKDLGSAYAVGGRGVVFGEGNTVPVVAMTAAHQSGTAYRCLERRAQFLEGAGFAAPESDPAKPGYDAAKVSTLGDTPVPGHPGKTANDLWAELCSYGAYHNGAAVLVRYRGKPGKYGIGEIHVLPFGSVRKTSGGTYLLNHKFGRKGWQRGETTEHLPFNPDPKQVRKEMEEAQALALAQKKPYVQAGQIFYIYTPKAGEEDYPLPPHWAGLETVLADAAYARYELDEVEGGFTAKGILAMLGVQNNTVVGEDGLTDRERTDEDLGLFTNAGARAAGLRRKSVIVIDVLTKETVPVWVPMNTTVDLKFLSDKKEAIGQEVCRHIGIPPILAGFAKAGQLGASQEILNAVQLTQDSLESLRKLLLRGFWRLLPSMAGQVPGLRKPLSFIDAAVLAALTQDEKRALAGYAPATTPTPAAP